MANPGAYLAELRRRLRVVVALDGLSRLIALATTLVLAGVAIDWAWRLPGGARLVVLLVTVAAVIAVIRARLWRPLAQDLSDRALAAFAERRVPALGGRLSTLVAGIDLGARESAVLAAALPPVASLVPAPRLVRDLFLAVLALGVAVAISAVDPGVATAGLRRFMLPLGTTEYLRRTSIEISVDRPVVPMDEAVAVRVARHHPDAGFTAPVELRWEGPAAPGGRRLPGLSGSQWTTALPLPLGRWTIEARCADALPVSVNVLVVRRPELQAAKAKVVPPAYSGRAAEELAVLPGSVLAGTRIALTVNFRHDAGRTPATVALRYRNAVVPVQLGPEGATAEVTITEPGDLLVDAADADGIALASAARFPIAVVADRAPVVALSGPRPREAVVPQATVEIQVSASDDLGLASLNLRANDKELTAWPDAAGGLAAQRTRSVPVAELAGEGGEIAFTAEARDANDVTGPGIGKSEPLTLRVVGAEALRQELDRLLGEARDRVIQARESTAAARAKAETADAPRRAAAQAATTAVGILDQVLRRWAWNKLPLEQIQPANVARGRLDKDAIPALAAAKLPVAEDALAEAERLLGSLLGEGDLTRQLEGLIARQKALGEEARAFIRAHLTKQPDAAGKALQANLAQRAQDLAAQVADLEAKVLAREGSSWTQAQDLVRKEAPANRLRTAAADLATPDRRSRAGEGQQAALGSMQRLLEKLRGGDAASGLADRAGALAAEQEKLVAALAEGKRPADLAQRQADLARETERLQREAGSHPAAARLAAAGAAETSAGEAMAGGKAGAAQRDAAAAAGLLREAQRQLAGEDPDKPTKDQTDLLAILREIHAGQSTLVTALTTQDKVLGSAEPAFDDRRQLAAHAQTQADLALRLKADALAKLAKAPIAAVAVSRVAMAMEASRAHLAKPALGAGGVRLARAALAELGRLIAIATAPPPPSSGSGDKGGGGGKGGEQPPFPPHAEIALLAAMQEELAQLTAANRPMDLAAAQGDLATLADDLAKGTRPDTRPAELVARVQRAMNAAKWYLDKNDRSAAVRQEHSAAVAALHRLLAESGNSGGGGGGGGGGSSSPPPPSSGAGAGDPQGGQAGQPGGQGQVAGQGTQGSAVAPDNGKGEWLNLPPERREQLREARQQALTPRQLQVYARYLELLEEGK